MHIYRASYVCTKYVCVYIYMSDRLMGSATNRGCLLNKSQTQVQHLFINKT